MAALVASAYLPLVASASPVLTITCHDLKGSTLHYGVPFWERTRAELDHKQAPSPHIVGPKEDGYDNSLTIVVDSASPRSMTIVWNESAATRKLRADAASAGIEMAPPTVVDAQIVAVHPDMVAALVNWDPQSVALYTFFPKLGTAFISTQGEIPDGTDSVMTSVRAACEFSADPYAALR